MNRQVRLYRHLLRVYPRPFRAEYADEMTRLFAEQLDDAAASGDPWGVARLWAVSLVDLALTAPGHHLRREEPVPRPVDVGAADALVSSSGPTVGPRVALGLLPLWLWALMVVITPGFMDPVFSNPPAVLGLPAGLVMALIAIVWMMLGVAVLYRTSTMLGALVAFLVFTVPAVFVVLMAPAMILIVLNLAV